MAGVIGSYARPSDGTDRWFSELSGVALPQRTSKRILVPMDRLGWMTCGVLLLSGGCGPSAMQGGFDSPNPAAKLYAIEYAVRSGDTHAIDDLVVLLDSDDPATRLMAIVALERLTGEDHGYRFDDDVATRNAAILRWELAVREMTAASGSTESLP